MSNTIIINECKTILITKGNGRTVVHLMTNPGRTAYLVRLKVDDKSLDLTYKSEGSALKAYDLICSNPMYWN